MKKGNDIQGQSLVFNSLFVLLNLTGITFVTMGFHDHFESSKWLFAGIGFGLIAVSSFFLVVFKGRLFMAMSARMLVGSLFIVSGLIKANDPMGFSYKLKEYFEDGALAFRIKEWFGAPGFSLEFLMDWALFLSVLICIAEIVLGVLILIGGRIKLVVWLTMLMMLFFTFLTWHTANCDADMKFTDRDTYAMNDPLAEIKIEEAKTNHDIKIISKNSTELVVDEIKSPQCVLDCGCFGDAMKGSIGRSLTPKESLWKDLVLVYLVFWIFIAQRKIQPNTRKENLYTICISMVLVLFFSYIFGWYFPFVFAFLSLIGALWVLRAGGKILGNYFGSSLLVTLLCLILTTYVLMFEPVKDYRPYAVGSNLKLKMNDGQEGKFESGFTLKNLKTGKNEFFTQAQYTDTVRKIWEDKNYKYVGIDTKELIPVILPSITNQFNPVIQLSEVGDPEKKMKFIAEKLKMAMVPGVVLYDKDNETEIEVMKDAYNLEEYDTAYFTFKKDIQMPNPELAEISIRDYIIQEKTIIILFSQDLKAANFEKINEYKTIFKKAQQKHIPMVMVCNSSRDEVNAWRKKHQFEIPVFTNDETELKAISRSNPSLMVVQKAVVKGKYPFRSLPTFEWIQKHILSK